jgi:hypothetical protein
MQDKVVLRCKLMRQATSKIVVVPPEVLALWHTDSGHINEYRDLQEIDRFRALKTNASKISEAKKI